jgi:hypothetical protein
MPGSPSTTGVGAAEAGGGEVTTAAASEVEWWWCEVLDADEFAKLPEEHPASRTRASGSAATRARLGNMAELLS